MILSQAGDEARGQTGPRDQASTPNGSTGPPMLMLDSGTPNLSEAGDETREPDGTMGPRDHRGTPNGSTGPPILDRGSNDSKPGWGRGTGPDGTTGPRDHAGTPNGATGPPILDPSPNDLR